MLNKLLANYNYMQSMQLLLLSKTMLSSIDRKQANGLKQLSYFNEYFH